MNSKHPEKDIDHLFKEAIDRAEAEPSDKFWNRAFEDIIKRENKMYGKQVRNWKIISSILGAAIILLAFYVFYIHGRVNSVEKQIAEIEKKQVIPAINNDNKVIMPGTTTPPIVLTTSSISINDQKTIGKNTPTSAVNEQRDVTIASNNTYENQKTTTTNVNNKEETLIAGLSKSYSNPGSKNSGVDKNPLNSSDGFGNNETPPGSYYSDTINSSAISKINNLSSTPSFKHDSSVTVENIKPIVSEKKDTTIFSLNQPMNDTLAKAVQRSRTAESGKYLHHFFISAFFLPELSDDYIKENDTWDKATADNIKTRETDWLTYSTGVRLGYDLSKHWSVYAGAYYHTSSFSISPSTVHGQWYNGQPEIYLMVTSMGTLDVPCQYAAGDSIKASGNLTSSYLTIPLQSRYKFTLNNRFGVYIDGGFTANILLNNSATMYWETSSLVDGHATLKDCDGLQNSFYSYSMGFGLTYKLIKNLSIFGEPEFQGAFTPINKNSSITTYPYLFGSAIGLTYHL